MTRAAGRRRSQTLPGRLRRAEQRALRLSAPAARRWRGDGQRRRRRGSRAASSSVERPNSVDDGGSACAEEGCSGRCAGGAPPQRVEEEGGSKGGCDREGGSGGGPQPGVRRGGRVRRQNRREPSDRERRRRRRSETGVDVLAALLSARGVGECRLGGRGVDLGQSRSVAANLRDRQAPSRRKRRRAAAGRGGAQGGRATPEQAAAAAAANRLQRASAPRAGLARPQPRGGGSPTYMVNTKSVSVRVTVLDCPCGVRSLGPGLRFCVKASVRAGDGVVHCIQSTA